jgi:ATP-independent RNA helicase DbpA
MLATVTSLSFASLPLAPAQLGNLDILGYKEMTPIQAQSLPVILEGRDLIAQAKTGSGKTATFGLGILHKLDISRFALQALVICPTRELADQVAGELRRLARFESNIKILTLVGGTPIRPQVESMEHGVHIAVGTPGRLIDHIERGSIDLSAVNTLVLDEADRMVDMGFFDDIVNIVKACPAKRQTLLFSATYPDSIRKDAGRFLNNPGEVKVQAQHDATQIEEHFFEIAPESRNAAVAQLLNHYRPASALAFCNTKAQCRELADELRAQGFSALALHGDLEQRDRDEVLVQFANQSCSVLVATDVAARGLDIQSLAAVINVDVTRDTEVHIHRIGRTGRGQEKGLALNLCAPHEMQAANLIEQYQGKPLVWSDLKKRTSAAGGPMRAPMVTLVLLSGKKDKLRPGDVLGALTGEAGLSKEQVVKINVTDQVTYVALERSVARAAHAKLSQGSIKGKRVRMRFI